MWYRTTTVLLPYSGMASLMSVEYRYAPHNGSAALRWPIVIFQVLSWRGSADFIAVVNFVLRFSPCEVHRSVWQQGENYTGALGDFAPEMQKSPWKLPQTAM